MSSPLHILHAIRQTTFGGGEVYLFNLVKALKLKGVESTILTFQDGDIGDQLRAEGFEVIHIPGSSAFDVSLIRKVAAFLSKRKFDLVHCHGTRAASNVLLPATWAKIPAIYTVHGWSFHPGLGKLQLWVRLQMERWLCNLATKVVCVGKEDAIKGQKLLQIKTPTVIVNGIPKDKFSTVPPLNLTKGKATFGFIGRMTYQKYPEFLAQAFLEVSKDYPDAKLVYLGGGELETKVKDILKISAKDNTVEFKPFSQDVASQLHAIDVLVLPSRWEGLSLSLLEAMMAGRYCLVSDIPNNLEVVENNKTGKSFSKDDNSTLVDAMKSILDDPATAMEIANQGKAFAETNFGFERVVDENLALYHQLIQKQ